MQIPPSRARIVAKGLVAVGQNMDLESLAQSAKFAAFETAKEVARSVSTAWKIKAMTKPVVNGRGVGGGVSQRDE